mgnify:CR=1 FL=1
MNKNESQFPKLCKDSLEASLDGGGVSTLDLLIEFTILVEAEGRHGRDSVGSSNLGEVIDVDLVELDVGVGIAELLEGRSDGLAGTAPGGVEVDDNEAGGISDLGLVLLGTGEEGGVLTRVFSYFAKWKGPG